MKFECINNIIQFMQFMMEGWIVYTRKCHYCITKNFHEVVEALTNLLITLRYKFPFVLFWVL